MTMDWPGSRNRAWLDAVRWSTCFAIVLFLHVGGAAALLARWHEEPDLVANAPVVMIELAPVPVAPQIVPNELPPGPQQTEVEPEPEPAHMPPPLPEQKPDETPQPELAMLPPPRPMVKPREHKPRRKREARQATAPSHAEHQATRAAAPVPGASSNNPNAVPNWKSLLVAQLERHKRYPPEAQSRGDHGVARVAFSIDRRGGVHHVRIVQSSGSSLLDQATLSLVERAQPLPPPPPEMQGTQIAIVVPIRYNIR